MDGVESAAYDAYVGRVQDAIAAASAASLGAVDWAWQPSSRGRLRASDFELLADSDPPPAPAAGPPPRVTRPGGETEAAAARGPRVVSPQMDAPHAWADAWSDVLDREVGLARLLVERQAGSYGAQLLQSVVGGATCVRDCVVRVGVEHASVRVVLVPVFMCRYTHEGSTYRVAINGHTGAVMGARPWRGESAVRSVRDTVERRLTVLLQQPSVKNALAALHSTVSKVRPLLRNTP